MLPNIIIIIASYLPWEEIDNRELILSEYPYIRNSWINATKFNTIITNNDSLYYVNGRKHREDGPAVIHRDINIINRIEYWINNTLHRADGPAIITMYRNGNCIKIYYMNGVIYRKDGPAYIKISSKKYIEE